MAEAKKTISQERLQEITAGIEQGIKELFDSDRYQAYLRTMSRFHHYSVNNQLLIHMQMPKATRVAGFQKWKSQFERHVKQGERGITIIAPTPYKKKVEELKLDPATSLPVLDREGRAVIEEKEVEIPRFRPVTVFDVSQTQGKPLPRLASDLHGDVTQYEAFMEALGRSSPVPVGFEQMEGMDGYFSPDQQRVAIREGMSQVQTVSAAVHEITHAKLHNYEKARLESARTDETKEPPKPKDSATEEVEAESVSYAVCQYYGIETGENSFGYIASWSSGKELPELRASLETISRTASAFINDIDQHFRDICQERGIDLTAPEQNPEADPKITQPEVQQPETPPADQAAEPEQAKAAAMLPSAPEQVLDQYPMPDPALTLEDLERCGYLDGDLLPLTKERALELHEKDLTVYAVLDGGEASMAFDREDIEAHGGLFAVPREEWGTSEELVKSLDRQQEREQAFLSYPGDCYAIYQLRGGDDLHYVRFEPLDRLRAAGGEVQKENYNLIYTAPLTPSGDRETCLNRLYHQFNTDHPEDFRGHSLSISDIIAIKQDGEVCCHYVDRFGFSPVPDFLQPENHLKHAEMSLEDDYGMIDGLINNGQKTPTVADLAAARREQEGKKTSVVKRLKQQPPQPDRKKTAPRRGAEREI